MPGFWCRNVMQFSWLWMLDKGDIVRFMRTTHKESSRVFTIWRHHILNHSKT
jgi:hypothetical protein